MNSKGKSASEPKILEWISSTQHARQNRNVQDLLDEVRPSLDYLASARVAAFIYDYKQANYLYFNDFFPEIFRTKADVIRQQGLGFLKSVIHEEDFLRCLNITQKSIHEFAKLKYAEKASMHFRLFFRARRNQGTYTWIMQTNKVFLFDEGERLVDVAMAVELFGDQHPLKVMGILETPSRTIEIYPDDVTEKLSVLSYRELEILQLIRAGLASKDIADKLKITANTVKVHRKNLLRKLEVNNMVQASRLLDDL